MSVLVTGGTGWIGSQLLPKLEHPIIVSRNQFAAIKRTGLPAEQIIECDPTTSKIDPARLSGLRGVVNLVGESIAEGRWNDQKKKRIRESRVLATQNLAESILECDSLPKVLISASATGYYGERGDDVVEESASPGDDFLAKVCADWERAAEPLIEAGVRVCFLRIGIVLGKGGGAMDKMLPPFRIGAGGRLGTGKQWMSWIHINDLVNMIPFLIERETCRGPFNGTAPNPVRNSQFTKSLGKALGRPAVLPVPEFALRLALGEFAEFLCVSQRIVPAAFEAAGFTFQFPDIESAFADIVAKQ